MGSCFVEELEYALFIMQIFTCPSEQCLSLLLWAGLGRGVRGGEGAELQSQLWGQVQGVHLGSPALYSSLAPKTSFYLLHDTHTQELKFQLIYLKAVASLSSAVQLLIFVVISPCCCPFSSSLVYWYFFF